MTSKSISIDQRNDQTQRHYLIGDAKTLVSHLMAVTGKFRQ